MIRAMREAGIVKALTNSLQLIDFNHPQVHLCMDHPLAYLPKRLIVLSSSCVAVCTY